MKTSERKQAETPATAVERTLAILEAVSQRGGGMTNAEISRKLAIPKSTASYMLRALEKHGYLRREDLGPYKLGVKVLSLGRSALSELDVRSVAMPVMRHLVEHSNLTAHLAILDGTEAVYVAKVDSPGFIKMDTWVGKRAEVHTTSVGKVLAAYVPEERVHEIVKARGGLRKFTQHTLTTLPRFLRDLEKVRERGYSMDNEENSLGVRCLAAPVFNETGRLEASLGVSGTVNQIPLEQVPRLAEVVKEAARRVSVQLGWKPRAS